MGWKKKVIKIPSETFKITLPEDYSTAARLTISVDEDITNITEDRAGATNLVAVEEQGPSQVLAASLYPVLNVTVVTAAVGENLEIIVYG
jgi:hypothetical protein